MKEKNNRPCAIENWNWDMMNRFFTFIVILVFVLPGDLKSVGSCHEKKLINEREEREEEEEEGKKWNREGFRNCSKKRGLVEPAMPCQSLWDMTTTTINIIILFMFFPFYIAPAHPPIRLGFPKVTPRAVGFCFIYSQITVRNLKNNGELLVHT